MASEVGQIPSDGGDYLRFLLMVKTIGAMKARFSKKRKLLESIDVMYWQDGHSFAEFAGRSHWSLEEIMETEFEYDDDQ